MATKNDRGMTGLLELLTRHPELIRELVLDQPQIKKLLGPSARRLVPGDDLTGFLEYMSSPEDGYAYAQCVGGTGGGSGALCAKGTKVALGCVGGTGGGNPTK